MTGANSFHLPLYSEAPLVHLPLPPLSVQGIQITVHRVGARVIQCHWNDFWHGTIICSPTIQRIQEKEKHERDVINLGSDIKKDKGTKEAEEAQITNVLK